MGRLDDIIRRNKKAGGNLVGLAVSTVEDAFDKNVDAEERRRKQIAWAIVLAIVAIGAIALVFLVRSSGDAPGGTVVDRNGNKVELSTLWTDRRVLVVFYPNRNCDGCIYELLQLDRRRDEIDATIIGIGAESASRTAELHDELKLRFELYADPNFYVTSDWHIPFWHDNMPRPALFVVEPGGAISFKRIGDARAHYPELDEILAATKRR
jgi:peroxiredoxin